MGFSGLVSPGLALWLLGNSGTYDLVHIHAGQGSDLYHVSCRGKGHATPVCQMQTSGLVT